MKTVLIKEIELRNFMHHVHYVLTLPPTGITVISGLNGRGKSSFQEGVAALWNKSLRNPKRRTTRGFWKNTEGSVKVTTVDDLVVTRSRTKGGTYQLEFARNGATPTNYATPSKALEALEQEIGAYDLWRRACVFASAHASGFTRATDGERRALLEELLDLERFSLAHEIAKKKLTALEVRHCEAAHRVHMHTMGIASITERIALHKANLKANPKPADLPAYDTAHKREWLELLRTQLRELEAKRDAAQSYEVARERLRAATEARDGLVAPASDEDAPDLDALRDEWNRLEETIAGLQRDLREAEVEVRKAELSLVGVEKDVQAAERKAAELADDQCPTCAQPISQEMRDALQATVDRLREELEAARDEAAEVKAAADEQADECSESITTLRERSGAVRDRGIRAKQAGEDAARRSKEYIERRTEADRVLVEARKAVPLAVDPFTPEDQEALDDRRTKVDVLGVELATREAEERTHARAVQTWQTNHDTWSLLQAQDTAELDDLNRKLVSEKQKLQELGQEMAVAKAGVAMLAPKGVRAHILQRALDGIETVCNRWLREFHESLLISLSPYSENAKGGTKMAIALTIQGREEGEDYEDLSGGEQRRLDLAMVLALSEVARLAMGVADWGTLWLDEILDAVDPEGADRVCEAIRQLSADRNVVVISHSAAIRDRLNPVQEIKL